nr:hypothetical protein [Asanoa siamensis]
MKAVVYRAPYKVSVENVDDPRSNNLVTPSSG